MNNALSVELLTFEARREDAMPLLPKVSLDGLEKAEWVWEPEPPKPATELLLPKAGPTEMLRGLVAIEVGNPENPDELKLEVSEVLKENEAADETWGFPNPKAGAEAGRTELAEGADPNAEVFPNTEPLPEEAVPNPGLDLKLKFWALVLLLLAGKPI